PAVFRRPPASSRRKTVKSRRATANDPQEDRPPRPTDQTFQSSGPGPAHGVPGPRPLLPGILLQAVRKHYRVVVLSLIGDYSNWSPVKGREKEFVQGTIDISKEYGGEMRYLPYASHRFDVDQQTKKAVAQVVAEVKPDVG